MPINTPPAGEMLAARVERFGGIDAIHLTGVPVPTPESDEVLVRVHFAGVGPWDALVRAGKSGLPQPLPLVLGAELSGEVVVAGSAVRTLAPGDAVFGVTNARFTGADAEYAAARAASLTRKPEWLSYEAAAALPVSAVTASCMLFEYGRLELGQRVLIHGAAGNVGRYAVQMAKLAGGHVVGTCFGKDVAIVKALGADEVIDVSRTTFVSKAKYADLVIDTVGGTTQIASFDVLVPGGRLVSSVSPPDEELAKQRRVAAVFFIVDVTTERLEAILPLFAAGTLSPLVGEIVPLAVVSRAHEMLAGSPHKPGKILLSVTGDAERS